MAFWMKPTLFRRMLVNGFRRRFSSIFTNQQGTRARSATGMLETLRASDSSPTTKSTLDMGRESALKASTRGAELNVIRKDYAIRLPRSYEVGDVYSPHDLTGQETKKWMRPLKSGKETAQTPLPKRQRGQRQDIIDVTGINPLHLYKNYTVMSAYVHETGKIMSGKLTGLRPVNQRKMAKAIRRAQGQGLMPSVHRHPLILMPQYRQAK